MHALEQMARGGIYDQLGGGFHRYSTDAEWLVPHFEKMLYDNAQLARVYLMGYQATGNAYFREVAEQVIEYVLRDMTDPSGGFYSTEDADSEGEEGKFYVWTPAQLRELAGRRRRAPVRRLLRRQGPGQLRGPRQHPAHGLHPHGGCTETRRIRSRVAGRDRPRPSNTVRCPRPARAARARRKSPRGLEWDDAPRGGRGCPSAGPHRLSRGGHQKCRLPAVERCAGPTARCIGPGSPATPPA